MDRMNELFLNDPMNVAIVRAIAQKVLIDTQPDMEDAAFRIEFADGLLARTDDRQGRE